MALVNITKKYQCLLYGEGKKDKNFLYKLSEMDKFKFHCKQWEFFTDHASGGSPETVLEKCRSRIRGYSYHLVLCFIDLDKLIHDFPRIWLKEKMKLEEKYSQDIAIVWQINNLEEELQKTIGNEYGKHKLNKVSRDNIYKFVNSDYYKRIIYVVKEKEKDL